MKPNPKLQDILDREEIRAIYNESRQMGILRTGSPIQYVEDSVMALIESNSKELLDKFSEIIGDDEKSKHVRRFQCPNYGKGCYDWADQWKTNSTAPYCGNCGKKMRSVEFDEEEGKDWDRNELRDEQRTKLNQLRKQEGLK